MGANLTRRKAHNQQSKSKASPSATAVQSDSLTALTLTTPRTGAMAAAVPWDDVGALEEFKDLTPRCVRLSSGDNVLVVRQGDIIYGIRDECAHKAAPLSEGDLEDLGAKVGAKLGAPDDAPVPGLCIKCPKHRKKFCGGLYFSLLSGKAIAGGPSPFFRSTWHQDVFPTKIHEGHVLIATKPYPPSHVTEAVAEDLKPGTVLLHTPTSPREIEWQSWELAAAKPVSHDSYIYSFVRSDSVPAPVATWLPSWHVALQVPTGTSTTWSVPRDYTPVSTWEQWLEGKLDMLIKIYPHGKLTSLLPGLAMGTRVHISSPSPTLCIPSLLPPGVEIPPPVGDAPVTDSTDSKLSEPFADATRLIGLIAGGTGVAPMYQLARLAIARPDVFGGKPLVRLLLSNHTIDDQLCGRELEALAAAHPTVFQLWHTLTGAQPVDWAGFSGRVSQAMIEKTMPPPHATTTIVVCGPPGMYHDVSAQLRMLGYEADACVELEA